MIEQMSRPKNLEVRMSSSWLVLKIQLNLIEGLDGTTIDTKGIAEQGIVTKKLADRLVSSTLLEVEGWKRIDFFPKTFKKFGFDKDSVSLTFKEVELPISIGNEQIYNTLGQTYINSHSSTFLVCNF